MESEFDNPLDSPSVTGKRGLAGGAIPPPRIDRTLFQGGARVRRTRVRMICVRVTLPRVAVAGQPRSLAGDPNMMESRDQANQPRAAGPFSCRPPMYLSAVILHAKGAGLYQIGSAAHSFVAISLQAAPRDILENRECTRERPAGSWRRTP